MSSIDALGNGINFTLIYAPGKEQRDEIAMAGLEKAHVEQFESLGFERTKVVRFTGETKLIDAVLLRHLYRSMSYGD